jgi:hypothetical protein
MRHELPENANAARAEGGAADVERRSEHQSLKASRRGPQLRCAFCGAQFSKTSKRPAHACSPRCRKALLREKARLDGVQVSTVGLSRCTLKKPIGSISCKAPNGHPYPCRFSVPVDVLGRGHRWPGASPLDRATREKIRAREIGGES